MSFIRQKGGNETKDESIDWCAKIWEVLEGNSRSGVHPDTLKVFTAAIMKILIEPEGTINNGRYGNFNEQGVLELTQKQANNVHKDFNVLYLNRNAYNTPSSKALDVADEVECTFKPNLSGSLVNTNRATVVPRHKLSQHIEQMMQFKEQQEEYMLLIIQ